MQNDFAARMDWCIADDVNKANHNPIAIRKGNQGSTSSIHPWLAADQLRRVSSSELPRRASSPKSISMPLARAEFDQRTVRRARSHLSNPPLATIPARGTSPAR
jgi:hypothetical protein